MVMPDHNFAVELDNLARVAVKVGLDLQPGQDLVLTAPVAAMPLVKRVVKIAYEAGAGLVTPILGDEELTLARFQNSRDEGFDHAPGWLYDGMAKAFDNNAARMAIYAENPFLLNDIDPEKVARANKAQSVAYTPARERITQFKINWNIISYPTASWAKVVFPDDPEEIAVAKLAHAIFSASRVLGDDPEGQWKQHNAHLAKRANWLNEHNFAALKYSAPGTDLTIGLAENHSWMGGAGEARNGITCNPNIPTEEVFTTPHAQKVDGYVRSTKPLSHNGTLIEDIEVRFEGGRIVEAKAKKGEKVLQKVLDTDAGARRLGEVALVPHSSPISASGVLFYNTLFDENAACHIALGQCYSECFADAETVTQDEVKARGGNTSAIHIDWMIGSGEMDIDGISQDGSVVPVFRKGEWA